MANEPSQFSAFIQDSFTSFLSSYEDYLKKVWESRSNFDEVNSDPLSLDWFPFNAPLPNLKCVYSVVKRFISAPLDDLRISNDLLQYMSVANVMLSLHEKKCSQRDSLLKLESLFHGRLEKPELRAMDFITVTLIKCQLSRLAYENGSAVEALHHATKAFEMMKDFHLRFVKEKDDSNAQRKLSYTNIEVKLCLAYAHALNENVSEVLSLIDEIRKDDFISPGRVRASRTSAFALSRFDLMLSHLSTSLNLPFAHPLLNAMTALTNTCLRLDLMKPGICRFLKCFDSPSGSKNPPSLAVDGKNLPADFSYFFEHIEHLFNCLYRIAYLWLKAGHRRFALIYISDGIVFSRVLGISEKELQFEALMAEAAVMEHCSEKIRDEINIMKDLLRYISDIEKEKKSTRVHLCSKLSSTTKEVGVDTEKALNSNGMVKDSESNVPIDTLFIDVASVVPSFDDPATSPTFERKNKHLKKLPQFFTHNDDCHCRLCTNEFLKNQRRNLAFIYASYLQLDGYNNEAVKSLEEFRKHTRRNQSTEVNEQGDKFNKAVCSEELAVIVHLATTCFNCGAIEESKLYLGEVLKALEDSHQMTSCNLLALTYMTVGRILLPECTYPHLDFLQTLSGSGSSSTSSGWQIPSNLSQYFSLYLDDVIDCLSTTSVCTPKIDENLASKMSRLKLKVASSEKKILTNRANIENKSNPKTPKKKSITRFPAKKNRGNSQTKSETDKFFIFDEDCDVDIKLGSGKNDKTSLPTPVFDENTQPLKTSTSNVRKKSRKVVFSFSSDDTEDDSTSTPNALKTPARPTRSSRRIATRNVVVARKEARLRHRLEQGPVYTDEEIQEIRPQTRKSKRKTVARKKSCSETEPEDVECPREGDCIDTIAVSIVDKELDNPLLSPQQDKKFDFDKLSCEECLKKSFESAVNACDYYQTKTTACLLALCHYQKNAWFHAAGFHMISVGVTYRITSHTNIKLCKRSMERALKKEAPNSKDPAWLHHLNVATDTVERTHPSQVISSMRDCQTYVDDVCKKIPPDWTVCVLSSFKERTQEVVMATRLRNGRKPLHLQLDGSQMASVQKTFEQFMVSNEEGMAAKEKSLWWTQRKTTSQFLDNFVKTLPEKTLGFHRGVLLGYPIEEKCRDDLQQCFDKINNVLKDGGAQIPVSQELIEIFVYTWKILSAEEKVKAVLTLLHSVNLEPNKSRVLDVTTAFLNYRAHLRCHRCKRGHVVLILDKNLQSYPWESVPLLHQHPVSRLPSIDSLLWQLELSKMASYSTADLQRVSYVINPRGDLAKTEERFSNWFSSLQSWCGVISRAPSLDEWQSYIFDFDVFTFCGHGTGSSFMHREMIARHRSRACALLMGCSSGTLHEKGVTEPDGMVLAYLMSGAPCVLACLWPVTDKDIDKYLVKCLSEWMKEGTALTDIVRKAETACKVPKLNGGACVVYGIPVQSCNVVQDWQSTVPSHFRDILS